MKKRIIRVGWLAFGALSLTIGLVALVPVMVKRQGTACGSVDRSPLTAEAAVGTGPREPVGVSRNGIFLAYPHDNSTIDAPSTFLAGAVAPGTGLAVTVGGGTASPVKVNGAGFFAQVVPLAVGTNKIVLVPNGDPAQSFELTIERPTPPKPVAAEPLQIRKSSLQPSQDLGLQPGDMITFGMHASPGAQATVKLGNRVIPLSQAGGSKINHGLDTTFGVTYQKDPASASDLYKGFYRITGEDHWQDEVAQFVLTGADGTSISELAGSKITVVSQPVLATTTHDNTVVRVGPGAGRTTPIADEVRVLVDGWVGTSDRCLMAPGKHLWIDRKDLQIEHQPGAVPESTVRTINIENENATGARLVIPLSQRLPYEIKQESSGHQKLTLKIYGATADTDWITEPSTSSKAVAEATSRTASANNAGTKNAVHKAYSAVATNRPSNPIDLVTWQQASDDVYQVNVTLKEKFQWGFWASYEGTNLVLHIKGAPQVAYSQTSLRGLRICVDPGHGGKETGAIGCSGIKEATINLAIAKRVQRMLQQLGAEVVMTRDSDVDVSLQDRVDKAVATNADLLISIHNNSLPDGRDPLKEHGTSSYYYHPQSFSLANYIRQSVVRDLGFVDFNTRWQNLALCRPSNMPAQLVEVGFLINPDEYATLLTEPGQERAASGIVKGIKRYVGIGLGKLADSTVPAGSNPKHGPVATSKKHR